MTSLPHPSSLILIAVMTSNRDLEIARILGWYRIPFRFAPKVVDVDYLAFYQTGAFGANRRWQIETFAEVRGHELTTRGELFKEEIDHPRAHEEYFKMQLGPLQTLETPIPADKWKRITFLYTTGELFLKAKVVDDLVVRSDERILLWSSLRERALGSGKYQTNSLPENNLDASILLMLGDITQLGEIGKPHKKRGNQV
jgi:hypothetical protein